MGLKDNRVFEKSSRRINPEEMAAVFRRAVAKGLLDAQDTAAIFYDLTRLKAAVKDLKTQFPRSALHAVAIKANPLKKILEHLRDWGVGLEAASLPELLLGERAGFDPHRLVYDSPVKSAEELRQALNRGVHLNADNFSEVERISAMRKENQRGTVGLRINPQIGTGRILSTSVAGEYSKFGVPLKERRGELLECFRKYPWLRGVHVHIGSQGCPLDLLVRGTQAVFDFVQEANRLRNRNPIDIIDIGGGLPAAYCPEEAPVSFSEYKSRLEAACPGILGDHFRLITEFGRTLHSPNGWVASRVEYVKNERNARTLMVHVGADLFLRECLNPDDWHHEMALLNRAGELKTGGPREYVIAGPLCFSGDVIDRGRRLPEAVEGDFLLIHDAGAYTLSMWSRYNSRQTPKVLGYVRGGAEFQILKTRESIETVHSFWGE